MVMTLAAAAEAAAEGQFGFGPHEPYSFLDDPVALVLPIILYCLPGLLMAVVLNRFASNLPLGLRAASAGVFPLFLWTSVAISFDDPGVTYFEGLGNLLSFAEFYLILIPGLIVVGLVTFLDQRRRSQQAHAKRFADDQ